MARGSKAPKNELQTVGKVITPFIGGEPFRPVLMHIEAEANGKVMRLTATDSFGLVSYTMPSDVKFDGVKLIPGELFTALGKAKTVAKMEFGQENVTISGEDVASGSWSKSVDYWDGGEFPNWRHLIPTEDQRSTSNERVALTSNILSYLTAVKAVSWEFQVTSSLKPVVAVAHGLPDGHEAYALMMPTRLERMERFDQVLGDARAVAPKLEQVKTA